MNQIYKLVFVFIIALGLIGCNTMNKVTSPNDQVLMYKLPYDLVYLRTLEAVDSKKDWVLDGTEKEKGTISVRNVNYSRLDDSDLRKITFLVKRVDNETVSISILPKDQHVLGGDNLLKVIGEYLSREVKS